MCFLEGATAERSKTQQWIRIIERWHLISDHFAAAPNFLRRLAIYYSTNKICRTLAASPPHLATLTATLVRPSGEVLPNELARALNISSESAKEYCDRLAEDGLIRERSMGNLRLFRLNRVGFAAREILRACHLLRLKDLGMDRIRRGLHHPCGLRVICRRKPRTNEAALPFW